MVRGAKFLLWLLLLGSSQLCFGSEPDIQCLKAVLESVNDSQGVLTSSWKFDNLRSGCICEEWIPVIPCSCCICQFKGVECWHDGENRVLSLRLGNLGLQGQFPRGLQNCTSITGLDLSNNSLSGPIPSDITDQVPYLTSLDLSNNIFSGEIPVNFTNMKYLNTLNLQHNQLSGGLQVVQFNTLARLTAFSVSDNLLSGPIPPGLAKFGPSSFVGNRGLCGAPLDGCSSRRKWRPIRVRLHRINDESSIGAAVGFVAGFVMAFYFPCCFVSSNRLHPYVFRAP